MRIPSVPWPLPPVSAALLLAGCFLGDDPSPSTTPKPAPWRPDSLYLETWSGGAKAAWSLIMDDFCGGWARGIQDVADTLMHNRGLVFSFAVIAGQCNDQSWEEARRLVSHGHFPANHSMEQFCAVADSWCPGPYWGPEDWAGQIDSSEALIERETGVRPAFMAFPYDLWTQELLDGLRARKYLGARASRARGKVNPPDFESGFDISWDLEFPADSSKMWQSYSIRDYVRAAVDQGGWAFQSAHGVDDGSYGSLATDSLRALADLVKSLSDSGILWNAVPTEVISYSLLRRSVEPVLEASGDSLLIRWQPRDKAPLADWGSRMLYDTDLTVTMVLPGKPGNLVIRQGAAQVAWKEVGGNRVRFEARPGKGPLRIEVGG